MIIKVSFMSDIKSKKVIVLKGILFLLVAIISSSYSLFDFPFWIRLCALLIGLWSFARFYYFLFYVLERYVDPGLKYSGILDLAKFILSKK